MFVYAVEGGCAWGKKKQKKNLEPRTVNPIKPLDLVILLTAEVSLGVCVFVFL